VGSWEASQGKVQIQNRSTKQITGKMISKCVLLALILAAVLVVVEGQTQSYQGTRCQPCRKINLLFALQNDAWLRPEHFESAKKFIRAFGARYKENMISGTYLGDFAELGVLTWNAPGNTDIDVPLTSNYTEFDGAVANLTYVEAFTSNFTEALFVSHDLLLETPADVARVVVLLVFANPDAFPGIDLKSSVMQQARKMAQQGTYLLLIGVGPNALVADTPSNQQFTVLSNVWGYNFRSWQVNAWDDLNNPSYIAALANFTCVMEPMKRFIRPACPSEGGSFANKLKSYPPGNYALGTFLPDGYTTSGHIFFSPPPVEFLPLSYTLEFWVFLRSSPLGKKWSFISQAQAGSTESGYTFFIGANDGRVQFVAGNGGNQSAPYVNLQSARQMMGNRWYHIAVNVEQLSRNASVFGDYTDLSYASIWVNGEVWVSTTFTFATTASTSGIITVGRTDNVNGTLRCNCVFDEIKFWNKCQGMTNLGARANYLLSGSESNLVAYYNFEDVTRLDFTDLSPSKQVARQVGATPWIVQVAESTKKCTDSIIPDLRDFETVCKGP